MALVRNASNRKFKGRIGDTVYYESIGRQVARQALNNSNYGVSARRSESQQRRRVRWSNLVNFYKASRTWMLKAFETKKLGQTDYNRFMSVNVNTSKVALTKDEALQAACVVEGFVISQGSLPSIEVTPAQTYWRTSLVLPQVLDLGTATVGQFATALVENNVAIEYGMQISFVSYQQFTTAIGIPQITCTFYEVTLTENSEDSLRDFLPEFCAQNTGGRLATSTDISEGAFAYILSDTRRGALRVSTQTLTTNNSTLIALYSSSDQYQKAIESYGVDDEVLLSPVSTAAVPVTPEVAGIDHLYSNIEGIDYFPGSVLPKADTFVTGNSIIVTKGLIEFSVVSIVFALADGTTSISPAVSSITVDDKYITIPSTAWADVEAPAQYITSIYVVTSTGQTLVARYKAGTE